MELNLCMPVFQPKNVVPKNAVQECGCAEICTKRQGQGFGSLIKFGIAFLHKRSRLLYKPKGALLPLALRSEQPETSISA